MNARRLARLQQMGLGPVWKLRHVAADSDAGLADSAAFPIEDELPATAQAPNAAMPPKAVIPMPVPALADDVDAMDWDTLEASIRSCTRCGLCAGRKHAVPGVGDRQARWLFIGEGPGRNEDLQGEPFVGPAGKLLDNMMRALGLARGENTYIANIVKCRPVGADGRDRPPAADEVTACMPYLHRQIALIRPDVIVALGKTAAVSLLGLGEETSLSSLRGNVRDYAGIPLVITYHPAYLLRKPVDKAKTWRDLCVAKKQVDAR